jgi:hypothetical protein
VAFNQGKESMPKVHYFQRYSTTENTVTNNTLLLLARIIDYSPNTASRLLSELTGEPISIGAEISQQSRGKASVPDGEIVQRSFKVLLEAKVDAQVDREQLVRHAQSFGNESQKVLLLLTKQPLGSLADDVTREVHARNPSVVFKSITYETVCHAIKDLFKEYESVMSAMVEDYLEYCNDANLFNQTPFLLRIVPCGQSAAINRKYGLYFQPADRGYTEHAFVGIYVDKAVRSIVEIESVFDVTLANGVLRKVCVQGLQTDKYDGAITDIIPAALAECGYEISTGNRFFCGRLADTNYRKVSPGGIQGARFVDLRDVVGKMSGLEDLASRLREKTWE